jgi:protein-S-isoprenylcysteine O-methyltransferase Ste14
MLARVDRGRLVMIPFAVAVLLMDIAEMPRHTVGVPITVLRWLGIAGSAAFYTLLIWFYLRRKPAVATSGSRTGHVCAVVATMVLFVLPLAHGTPPGPGRQLAADSLVAAGLAWSVWAIRFLGPNFSVLPQARGIASEGPYRWLRHPLYAGEIVAALGIAVGAWSPAAAGLWVVLCALQAYRAVREEQVLLLAVPGYRAYRARTAALLPGIF